MYVPPKTVFTPAAVARIHVMRAAGSKPADIAREIGTTVGSLSVTLSNLARQRCLDELRAKTEAA